jgi:CheY-like chemotaxis protein
MQVPKASLLVVDDEPLIRSSLSVALSEIGYSVRTADDGFSALFELRTEIPDFILSDLNMPGMSGVELLAVIRRRFPAIQTVAMSGMFFGNEAPSGISADAFYQKGSSVGSLLRILGALSRVERRSAMRPRTGGIFWIQQNGQNTSGEGMVTLSCPECLRTFAHLPGGFTRLVRETECIFCHIPIHYAIVQQTSQGATQIPRRIRARGMVKAASVEQSCN